MEIEDFFKGGSILTGLAIGVGAAVLAPVVKPLLRPVAKSVLKAGIAAYEEGRTVVAELSEKAEDVIAEVRAEMEKGEGHKEPSTVTVADRGGNGSGAEAKPA